MTSRTTAIVFARRTFGRRRDLSKQIGVLGDSATNAASTASHQLTGSHVIGQILYPPSIPCNEDFNLLTVNMKKCTAVQVEAKFNRSCKS